MHEVAKNIDLDRNPVIPEGLSIELHKKQGLFVFDSIKVKLTKLLHKESSRFDQNKMRKIFKKASGLDAFNTVLLDWYLGYPENIPDDWKGKRIFFWGTLYKDVNGTNFVRYLEWNKYKKSWHSGTTMDYGCKMNDFIAHM